MVKEDIRTEVQIPSESLENVSNETIEEETEENTILPEQTIQDEIITDEKTYHMLDFDRRLVLSVGQQDEMLCSIYCLAYARAILDNDMNCNPYDYYDGDGAVWRWAEFEDIASSDPLSTVLYRAYEQISEGRPVILFVSGDYGHIPDHKEYIRSSGDHYVVLIGYRKDADLNTLHPSDFYAIDPTRGYSYSAETHMPWIVLNDEAPETINGEYALYAPADKEIHVSTCYGHTDICTWDSSLDTAIFPEYIR